MRPCHPRSLLRTPSPTMRGPGLRSRVAAALVALLLPLTAAQARPGAVAPQDLVLPSLVLPGTDWGSGDPANIYAALAATPGAWVDMVSYQLTIAVQPGNSAIESALISLGTTSSPAVVTLVPLWQNPQHSGTITLSRSFSLAAEGQSFQIDSDGLLQLEFYDFADDVLNMPDSTIVSGYIDFVGVGRVQVGVVPEPASFATMALGLLALGAQWRRCHA